MKEALNCSEKEQWEAAMQKEMDSIYTNGIWDLVELPANRTPVGSKWVFKKKTKADGSIERYKARLVAQGFSQKQGLDYDETFSPVIRFKSFRCLVAVAVQKRLKLHQLDITAAFLNGHLEEEVRNNKSTTGYMFQIGGTAVTWKSKKQSCVALSTAEAEYIALSSAAQEAVWMQELSTDLRNPQSQPTLILEDNQSAISIAKNPQFHGRTKHFNIKYHFIREQVSICTICLEYCPTEDTLADLLTKGI